MRPSNDVIDSHLASFAAVTLMCGDLVSIESRIKLEINLLETHEGELDLFLLKVG